MRTYTMQQHNTKAYVPAKDDNHAREIAKLIGACEVKEQLQTERVGNTLVTRYRRVKL